MNVLLPRIRPSALGQAKNVLVSLSSEMFCPARWIRLRVVSFERSLLLLRERRGDFQQISPAPHPAKAFNVLRHLLVFFLFLLPSWKPIGKAAMNVHCAFVKGALQRNMNLCITQKGIARPQSPFSHSCVCERSIYSHGRPTYFTAAK
jgi:hypothetical protein